MLFPVSSATGWWISSMSSSRRSSRLTRLKLPFRAPASICNIRSSASNVPEICRILDRGFEDRFGGWVMPRLLDRVLEGQV